MSISLSAGSIPPIYRQLFEMIDGYGIHLITVTVFTSLFESATLSKEILTQLWNKVTKTDRLRNCDDFYACLALMALSQQGKPMDERILQNLTHQDLPIPSLPSKDELESRFLILLRSGKQQSMLFFRYHELCALDTIHVELLSEKKGTVLRHVEYEISSMCHRTKVFRRYSDFIALDELLRAKYQFRIVPQLPPKKSINVDKSFLEERRRALQRYLQILSHHPTFSISEIFKYFITSNTDSCAETIKAMFKHSMDESNQESKTSMPKADSFSNSANDADNLHLFRTAKVNLLFLYEQFQHVRHIFHSINMRRSKNVAEMNRFEENLKTLAKDNQIINQWATGSNNYWRHVRNNLATLSVEINAIAQQTQEQCKRDDQTISEHFDALIDLLESYQILCKQFEESLEQENKALGKLQRQKLKNSDTLTTKYEADFKAIEKRNIFALKCVQNETQLVYANLEAFIFIISNFVNSETETITATLLLWKTFAHKISQMTDSYQEQAKNKS